MPVVAPFIRPPELHLTDRALPVQPTALGGPSHLGARLVPGKEKKMTTSVRRVQYLPAWPIWLCLGAGQVGSAAVSSCARHVSPVIRLCDPELRRP